MGSKNYLAEINPGLSDKALDILSNLQCLYEPSAVLQRAGELLKGKKPGKLEDDNQNTLSNALVLQEFEKGSLLSIAVRDIYKSFSIDLMRRFQTEYQCSTPSEKATAELVALSFVRVLDAQRRITEYLDGKEFTDIGVQYLAMWSKELDRANRHYLTAIQVLRSSKQPPLQVKVTADTAIIGQNQLVQANNHV